MTSPISSSSTSSLPVSTPSTVGSSVCSNETPSVTASVTPTPASVFTSPSSASPVVSTSVASSVFTTDSASGMPSLFSSFTPSVPSSNTASTPLSSPGSASTSNMAASNSSLDISGLFGSQLNIDPEQLKFSIGESPSKSPGKGFNFVKSPTAPTASAPVVNPNNTGLFGSSIVAEATRAPTRFKFGAASGSATTAGPAPSASLPAARKVAGPRDYETTNTHQMAAGTSSGALPSNPYIPSLGKDITVKIRSASSNSANNPTNNSAHKPCPLHSGPNPQPSLQDSEVFKILAGYQHLKQEVGELRAELAASHTSMKELMTMFTSEAAKINVRLTTLEWKSRKNNPQDRTDDAINFVLENLGLNKEAKKE